MVACQDCLQEMTTADSCIVDEVSIHGERFGRRRVGRDTRPDGRCGDCSASRGGLHHPGCDTERCPRCGRQLITCGCHSTGDQLSSLVWLAGGEVVFSEP